MTETTTTIELTADVVASYLGNHKVAVSDLPALIRTVYGAFTGKAEAAIAAEIPRLTRAQIRNSVTPDKIFSFEDGRGYTALRRHLARYDLTPAAYKQKWGLPSDYPMVAAAYSERRSELAKSYGFGRKAPATVSATRTVRKPRARKVPAA
jgi:predicted transcriptional regulator